MENEACNSLASEEACSSLASEVTSSSLAPDVASKKSEKFRIAVVGGGVAGTTAALRCADLGMEVHLFESGPYLVNGPPFCHLHAGGSFYRDIPIEQCFTLLEESIASVRAFPHVMNKRPTVVIIPTVDPWDPQTIIQRFELIKKRYAELIDQDPLNKVIGEPDEYSKSFDEEEVLRLGGLEVPVNPSSHDEWMVSVAKHVNTEVIKFPIISIVEWGWNILRHAALIELALERSPLCHVHLNSHIVGLTEDCDGWSLTVADRNEEKNASAEPLQSTVEHKLLSMGGTHFNYLINACGYRTGDVDDIAKRYRKRFVEYKAAYISYWPTVQSESWPELIIHGQRGTVNGMAQLTPYNKGTFQLHGMTTDITLFDDGLVATDLHRSSSQPTLPSHHESRILHGWDTADVSARTERGISHIARYIPKFSAARPYCMPLHGAQQIPGDDPSLRAHDLSFDGPRYARIEIVKASSALTAAGKIVDYLLSDKGPAGAAQVTAADMPLKLATFKSMESIVLAEVVERADSIAKKRGLPYSLVRPIPPLP